MRLPLPGMKLEDTMIENINIFSTAFTNTGAY
jgi:hypothetical protein